MGNFDIEKMTINPDSIYLEEAKKKYLIDTYQKGIEKRNSIRFEVYENATILPVRRTLENGHKYVKVGVLTSEGDYVKESAVDNLLTGGYISESYASDKTAAYLGSDHDTWGHFLVNVVPRVWIALEHDSEIDEYVIVRDLESGSDKMFKNQMEFFGYLGILNKIRILTVPVRFSKVILPEASYRYKSFIGKETERGMYFDEFTKVFDVVSQRALKAYEIPGGYKYKKVFFSRLCNTDGRNYDIGIELINSFFSNNGYLIVYPENTSLAELIYYLNNCEIAAYISGTLQHNMLFAPQGVKTIAIERRIMISMYQTDIDLMKSIRATYVSAQYTILPDNFAFSSTYAYCRCLQKFIKESEMNSPDDQYTHVWYLKKCVIKYLQQYVWNYPLDTPYPVPVKNYYCEVLRDNLDECGELIPEIRLKKSENIKSVAGWKEKIHDLLISNNISYSLWDEKDIRRFIKTICALIEKNLKKGRKKFLLYPYGVNGLIIDNILRQRYGIHPQAIFDNGVSDYNVNVMKLNEIRNYLSGDSCVMLTTCSVESREELENYCKRDIITDPYTVF